LGKFGLCFQMIITGIWLIFFFLAEWAFL
jgi:hypothetical protein